jgi:hypothetical protein
VDGTGSESCPIADFGTSGVEPLGSATRDLVMSNYLINTYLTFATVSIYLQHLRIDLEGVVHANCFFKDSILTFLQKDTSRNEASVYSQLNNFN